jgi:hypothetical protein
MVSYGAKILIFGKFEKISNYVIREIFHYPAQQYLHSC